MKPPRVKPFTNETALSTACQKRIREEYGGEVLKVFGSAMQKKGTPDLLACIRGRFVAVELKQPGNKPTSLQYSRMRKWEAAGGLAGWATTEVEMDALLEHVDDYGWKNPQLAR